MSKIRQLVFALLWIGVAAHGAVNAAQASTAPRLVTKYIDDAVTVALPGNTRPEVRTAVDRGRVDDSMALEHMQLLLKRPPETESALRALVEQLHDRASPQFHHWLTVQQLRAEFGPAPEDVSAVTDWLMGAGFTINGVQASAMIIDFSGTAAQVRLALKTEIHDLDVSGIAHIANMSDPHIPAALASVVAGIVSLHDFRPHTNFKPRPAYTIASGPYYAVVPADLATIYHLNPLFAAGISGQGQTIVVIEDSDAHSVANWTTFRNKLGLARFTSGSFTQVHPAPSSGTNNCTDPGIVPGTEVEAQLDAEWASAGAPNAAIVLASCADTNTTFGGLIALQNLLNSANPPAIVSISYGECEAFNGATANAAFNSAYQQAVAQGTSVYVSAGDEGAASCNANESVATLGIGVNGFASTPYNVAVGGTDFGDTYAGTSASYWSSTNGKTDGSALSYIPEIPWNDSCASVLLATFNGFATTYGSSGFCNSDSGEGYLTVDSGSGGPSGCATGAPAQAGVVGGTCAGYAKPSWQSLVGNPADQVRDLPDVSLFAADGAWLHFYVFCDSDIADGGAPCTGDPSSWSGGGGTSFAAPIWAGFQALVNQKTGSPQGNPNPVLYALAATEYGASGSNICNSNRGKTVGSACIFHDVTEGDMDVNCRGSRNCYMPSGTIGVLSKSDAKYLKAYGTTKGWDFATGIGTVNVTNLVNNW
jgi:subtilase family serine protease